VQAALAVAQVVEADADLDFALVGVLDRVRQQVAEHLAQAQRVADDHARDVGSMRQISSSFLLSACPE